jgi:hypothetical protein
MSYEMIKKLKKKISTKTEKKVRETSEIMETFSFVMFATILSRSNSADDDDDDDDNDNDDDDDKV